MTSKQFEIALIIMASVIIILPVLSWLLKKKDKEISEKNYDDEVNRLLELDEWEEKIS